MEGQRAARGGDARRHGTGDRHHDRVSVVRPGVRAGLRVVVGDRTVRAHVADLALPDQRHRPDVGVVLLLVLAGGLPGADQARVDRRAGAGRHGGRVGDRGTVWLLAAPGERDHDDRADQHDHQRARGDQDERDRSALLLRRLGVSGGARHRRPGERVRRGTALAGPGCAARRCLLRAGVRVPGLRRAADRLGGLTAEGTALGAVAVLVDGHAPTNLARLHNLTSTIAASWCALRR